MKINDTCEHGVSKAELCRLCGAAASPAAPQQDAQSLATVIEGPSSTEYEAWLETRPDLTARFETDTFKRTTGYEIWRNAWLRLRELIAEQPAAAAPTPSQPARDAGILVKQWIATLQDESHVTDEDAEDLVLRIIAFKPFSTAAETVVP